MKQSRLNEDERRRLSKQLATSKKKPKLNLTGIPERDECQTPPYAVLPLVPYIPKEWIIWECASGEGWLAQALRYLTGCSVIETDLIRGMDFFKTNLQSTDIMITNVPFSIKYDWLEYSYSLKKPFAYLMPFDTWAAGRAQAMFQKYGINVILMNRRINFKMPSHKTWSDVYKERIVLDDDGNPRLDKTGKIIKRKSTAQMSTAWFCRGLPDLTKPVTYVSLPTIKEMDKWLYAPTKSWLKEKKINAR